MIWGWENICFVNCFCGGIVILVVRQMRLSLQNYFHCYHHRVGTVSLSCTPMRRKRQFSLKTEIEGEVASVIKL